MRFSTRAMANKSRFRIGPRHAVTAILSASQVDACVTELQDNGFRPADIDVLEGEQGRLIFDITGVHHGVKGRLIRAVQVAGSVHNEMLNYDSALRNGRVVVLVRVTDHDQIASAARVFVAHDGDRVVAYGRKGSETQWL
jgi:hypothetical protein